MIDITCPKCSSIFRDCDCMTCSKWNKEGYIVLCRKCNNGWFTSDTAKLFYKTNSTELKVKLRNMWVNGEMS